VGTMTEIATLRRDFPILERRFGRYPLTYLDSAATTQKPRQVIDAMMAYYLQANANVHRAAHALSDQATADFEAARCKVQGFINARHAHEVIWTRGTTEAINLVATSFGDCCMRDGDEIVISEMEHHSNIVPWQQLCRRTGARLRAIRIGDDGDLDLDHYRSLLTERTRLVAVGHVSNALGTINPVREIIALAHACGARVLIDGAQALAHLPVDVQELDADFYAASSHKMYGPTGVGVLYGKEALLEDMPPYQTGGEMVETVTLAHTTFNRLPFKFEAGTPHIAGAIGMAAAVEYLTAIDREALETHEARLLAATTAALQQIEGVRLVGTASRKIAIVSFLVEGAHPEDVGTLLDQQGVAVRTGHHCAMPLMQRLGLPGGTARASFGLYSSDFDVERLTTGLIKVREML
jgi:cysteine desulfurase / selenocysteine lyase